MLREDKERIVTELAGELGAAETLIVADYRGLTNKQLESLRDVNGCDWRKTGCGDRVE